MRLTLNLTHHYREDLKDFFALSIHEANEKERAVKRHLDRLDSEIEDMPEERPDWVYPQKPLSISFNILP